VRGETDTIHDALFAELNLHASYEPQRAVRTERWKYIRHFDTNRPRRLANCDESPRKDVWLARGWTHDNVLPEHRL